MADANDKQGVRINRFLSAAGFCSRRKADEYVSSGAVTIDDQPAEMGSRVNEGQSVKVNGQPIVNHENRLYVLLYKPVGITCTTDKRRRDNIIDYLGFEERIFPVGRLDRDSEGLIILTNDGLIVNRILRQHNNHEKEYRVTVNKPITDTFLKQMASGVPILNTVTRPCKIWREQDTVFRIILTQGLNRQIRRMCEFCGYEVKRLIRVRIMHLTIDSMKPGQWRYLTPRELKILKGQLQNSQS